MAITEKVIENFVSGIIDTVDSQTVPDGSASSALNWLDLGDRIELRRGFTPVGTESASAGKINGIVTAFQANGNQVTFRKNGQKLEYFAVGSSDWAETLLALPGLSPTSNIFGAAAAAEDAAFAPYTTNAGNQLYVSSPSSGLFKVMLANPGYAVQCSSAAKNFSGKFRMKVTNNRMLAWGRPLDKTGIYGSYIDAQAYTTVAAENDGTGDGSTKTFAFTLQQMGVQASPARTCFAVSVMGCTGAQVAISAITQAAHGQVTANGHGLNVGQQCIFYGIGGMTQLNGQLVTVFSLIDANRFTIALDTTGYTAYTSGGTVTLPESVPDDFNGALSDAAGSTGTVNYATGAVSVTFAAAPASGSPLLVAYQWEDSTNTGIADFTHSTPRTAGQGFVFRQDEGGADLENSFTYNSTEYSFHKLRTWELNINQDDTTATNLPYRARVGISNWQNGVATGTGVYYVNDIDKNNVKLEKLALNQFSTAIVPTVLSKQVSQETGLVLGVILDGYLFDQGALFEWGDFIVITCRTASSLSNNRIITYNKLTNAIDYHDLTASCFAINGSELWAGDSTSPNVYRIFSGFDDGNASDASNFWVGKNHLVADFYLAKVKKLVFQGQISATQAYGVYAAVDNGSFSFVGSISGSGSYVDKTSGATVPIGFNPIGTAQVGPGQAGQTVYNYEHALPFKVGKLVHLQLKFVATGIGYLSISRQRLYDIQAKSLRVIKKYA